MRITVLHCPASIHGPYHIVHRLDQWPDGTIRNRGWRDAPRIYVREATEREEQWERDSYRHQCWRYRSWEALAADEAKFQVNADLCRALYRGEVIRLAECRLSVPEAA